MLLRTIVPGHIKGLQHYTYAHILEDDQHPFYIGLGTNCKKSTKYSRAKTNYGRNKYWKNITKNKNYIVVICSESDDYEITKLHEIDAISELGKRVNDCDGLLVNISDGGDGCKGYKHTEEHLKILKERYTGSNNPMFGKKASEETRKKMSDSQKGRTHSEYTKHIISIKKQERGYQGPVGKAHPRARKVNQIDPITKNIIATFDTLRIAAVNVGTTDKAIGKACRQGFKVKHYNWEYGN